MRFDIDDVDCLLDFNALQSVGEQSSVALGAPETRACFAPFYLFKNKINIIIPSLVFEPLSSTSQSSTYTTVLQVLLYRTDAK